MPSIMRNNIRYGSSFGGGSGNGEIIKLTQAEYNALPESQKKSGQYLITDAEGMSAKYIPYDDSETGLGVDNVQDAIDELSSKLEEIKYIPSPVKTLSGTITKNGAPPVGDYQVVFETPFDYIPKVSIGIVSVTHTNGVASAEYYSATVTEIQRSYFVMRFTQEIPATVYFTISWVAEADVASN